MAVVFDSVAYTQPDKVSAAQATFREQSAPSTIEFHGAAGMSAVMEAWSFGHASVFRATMTGNRLVRSAEDVRRGPNGRIGIAVQECGIGRFEQHGRQQIVRPGELMVVDLDAPYDFGWSGMGGSRCVHVPFDAVAMSRHDLRDAVSRLQTSPLYDLMRRHITDLDIAGDTEIAGPVATALGESTLALATTFLSSARTPGAEYRTGSR